MGVKIKPETRKQKRKAKRIIKKDTRTLNKQSRQSAAKKRKIIKRGKA